MLFLDASSSSSSEEYQAWAYHFAASHTNLSHVGAHVWSEPLYLVGNFCTHALQFASDQTQVLAMMVQFAEKEETHKER